MTPPPSQEPSTTKEIGPKLDTFLSRLSVYGYGDRAAAEAFARQHAVQLVDGKVRVEIEAMPGQLDAAVTATTAAGTVELIVRDIHHVQAVVPIESLAALSKEPSIKMIRNPGRVVPQAQ